MAFQGWQWGGFKQHTHAKEKSVELESDPGSYFLPFKIKTMQASMARSSLKYWSLQSKDDDILMDYRIDPATLHRKSENILWNSFETFAVPVSLIQQEHQQITCSVNRGRRWWPLWNWATGLNQFLIFTYTKCAAPCALNPSLKSSFKEKVLISNQAIQSEAF